MQLRNSLLWASRSKQRLMYYHKRERALAQKKEYQNYVSKSKKLMIKYSIHSVSIHGIDDRLYTTLH